VSKVCVVCDTRLTWPDSRHRVCGGLSPRAVMRVTGDGRVQLARESSDCALKYRARQARDRRLQARADRACPCGKRFTPTRSDGVYCSGACRQRSHRERNR
jgi:hypothetical protein